jgi:hypothetical protein
VNDYITAWSGSLERSGACPTLSRYQGASSLAGMGLKAERPSRAVPTHTPHAKGSLDHVLVPLLRAGVSYQQIRLQLGCSENMARNCARRHGIDRRHLFPRGL